MVIICYANRMKSEQILMKSIQIILTSFLNQFGRAGVRLKMMLRTDTRTNGIKSDGRPT